MPTNTFGMSTITYKLAPKAYRLTYFDGQGRAEVARLLFTLSRTPYVDERIQRAQWPEMKQRTPFGQLPMLRVNDVKYCRSEAIFRYLAREFGYYGKTIEDGISIDFIIANVLEVFNKIVKIWELPVGDNKDANIQAMKFHSIPKLIQFLDSRLSNNKWLLGGDDVSLADVVAFAVLTSPITKEYILDWQTLSKAVADLVERFAALPAVADHVDQRQPSTF